MAGFRDYAELRDNPYSGYLRKLHELADRRGFLVEDLGLLHSAMPLYRVVINPDAQRTYAVISGLHGNERAGPFSVLKFMATTSPSPDVRVVIMPLVNPQGFVEGKRRNSENRDLNRQWCKDTLHGDAAKIARAMEDYKPEFLHTLHEDPAREEFYLYFSDKNNPELYDELIGKAEQFFPILGQKTVFGDRVKGGKVDAYKPDENRHRCSIEGYYYRKGLNFLVTETPGQADLSSRVEFTSLAMDWVISRVFA